MNARDARTPFLLLAMLAAAIGAPRLAPSGSSSAAASETRPNEPPAVGKEAASAPASPAAAKEPDGWSGPLRLYGEFFGRETTGDLVAADTEDAVRKLVPADRGGYELDFLVALVPDPIDSEMPAAFDQALDGIQRGFANRFFLLDRRWLPWRTSNAGASGGARGRLHRLSPGLLLFRRDGLVTDDVPDKGEKHQARCLTAAAAQDGQVEHCLAGVFLVGETPKRGIHQAAFLQALRLIRALGRGGRGQTVKILGPTYSGSAESLRLGVRLAQQALGPLDLEIVTGSATAIDTDPAAAPPGGESFEAQLRCEAEGSVSFWRTVIPDRLLQPAALNALDEKMGWDPTRVALVVEGDTEYGQRLGRDRFERHPSKRAHARPESAPAGGPAAAEHGTGLTADVARKLDANLGGDSCLALSIGSAGQPPASNASDQSVSSSDLDKALILHFPNHVAAIRSAGAGTAGKRQPDQQQTLAFEPRQTELDLALADQGRAADSVPELSPLTAPDNEQAIANLLGEISREGIGYVGILATDVRDKLYLAERIHKFSPDVTLFTFDGDLLYAHRQVQASMNGTAVISTFQLFTEGGGAARHGVDPNPEVNHRRQFTSELNEGFFHAVRVLLSPTEKRESKHKPVMGWISVTSNGSLWPLLSIELDRSQVQGFHVLAIDEPDTSAGNDEPLSQRADLELLIAALVLCWLARSLRRSTPPQPAAPAAGGESSSLLSFGLLLLALAAGLVLALEGIEYARPFGWLSRIDWWAAIDWLPQIDSYPRAYVHLAQALYIAGLGVAYLFLVFRFVAAWRRPGPPEGRRPPAWRQPGPPEAREPVADRPRWAASWRDWAAAWLRWAASRRRWAAYWLGWLAAAAGALAVLWFALLAWFIPGEVEYFELRTRVFSSGLSPVVSLGWLVGALYLWVLLELKRRCVTAWHEVEWPLTDTWDPALARSGKLAGQVSELISCLPKGRWVATVVPAALLGTWLVLWRQVQPAAESRAYAGVFMALALLALACGALSFWRFWQVWRLLRRILLRVEETPLKARFKGLSEEVAWKPMRSFGWQLPRFDSLELSIRRLQALLRADRPDRPDHLTLPPSLDASFMDELSRCIAEAFAADSEGSPALQIECRRKLQELLAKASQELGNVRGDPEIEDFLALRVMLYLRFVFSHLRGYLMGGIFPGVLLLVAISSYAFVPKAFCSLGLLAALLGAAVTTVGVFMSMNRNAVLSLIAGSEAGEVRFDLSFFTNLLTYALLPLLGLLATQVPAAGFLLDDWLRPLLRTVGLG
jgi:hypothetical protein